MEGQNPIQIANPTPEMLQHHCQALLKSFYNQCAANGNLAPSPEIAAVLTEGLKIANLDEDWLHRIMLLRFIFEDKVSCAYSFLFQFGFGTSHISQQDFEVILKLVRDAANRSRFDPREVYNGREFTLEESLKLLSLFHRGGSYPSEEAWQEYVLEMNANRTDGNAITEIHIQIFFHLLRVKQNDISRRLGGRQIHIDIEDVQLINDVYVRRGVQNPVQRLPHIPEQQPQVKQEVIEEEAPVAPQPAAQMDEQQMIQVLTNVSIRLHQHFDQQQARREMAVLERTTGLVLHAVDTQQTSFQSRLLEILTQQNATILEQQREIRELRYNQQQIIRQQNIVVRQPTASQRRRQRLQDIQRRQRARQQLRRLVEPHVPRNEQMDSDQD